MGNARRKMTNHVAYRQHHLSQVLNSVLEHNISRSKMAIQQDGSQKLELRPKKCLIKAGGVRRRMASESEHHHCHLPMDLRKRTNNHKSDVVYADVTSTDEEVEMEEIKDCEEVDGSDEPLNLSTVKVRSVEPPTDNNGNSGGGGGGTDLLQKRVRLEEMVSYIRKCSVMDTPKYHINSSSTYAPGGGSDADSEGEDADKHVMKRNIVNQDGQSSAHRRKRSVPYRGGRMIRVTYNSDAQHHHHHQQQQRSYPVLRQQLLRAVDGEDDEEDEQSDVAEDDDEMETTIDDDEGMVSALRRPTVTHDGSSGVETPIVPHAQWSTYAYYASLFQELQSSLPAAAQGLLITATNPNSTDDLVSKNDQPNSQQQPQQHQVTENSNGNGASANALLRKRAPRALTGKHVKHGTGASPATLLTLRQKIEQKMNQQPLETANKVNNGQLRHQENGGRRTTVLVKRSNKKK